MFRHHLCDGLLDIIGGGGWHPELQPHLARSAALVTLQQCLRLLDMPTPNARTWPKRSANLAATYGESPRVTGLMTDGNMLIITAAPSGGEACMVAAGEGFGIQDAAPPGDDS